MKKEFYVSPNIITLEQNTLRKNLQEFFDLSRIKE